MWEKFLLQKRSDRVFEILEGRNPPPYELEIQPSSVCNASCKFCWAKDFEKLEDKLNTLDGMERILEQVLSFRKNGFEIEIVKFCGSTGEPLVNPFTLYAIERLYGERYIRLFTNGIKLAENKDDSDYLGTISKVNRLNVSLDAGRTETLHELKKGSRGIELEDILGAVKRVKGLSEKGMIVDMSYVVTNDNYLEIVEATEKVKMSLADRIRFRIDLTDRTVSLNHGEEINSLMGEARAYEDENFKVTPIHSEEEIRETDARHFSSREEGFGCYTCRFWSCIGSDGCLYPCGHVVAGDMENYGSILEKSFGEVWEGFARERIIGELPVEKCNICSPFSLRLNEFMTFLSGLDVGEVKGLKDKYIEG